MVDVSAGSLSLLACLPASFSSRLFSRAVTQRILAGKALFFAGDPGDGCYRVEKGLLKITLTSPQGEELVLAFLGQGAMVGELSVLDGLARSATAIAVTNCELSFVSRRAFEQCLQHDPALYRCIVHALASRLRATDETFAAASFLTSKGRIARALFELAALLGEDAGSGKVVICHSILQRDLAAMAGVARENVNRALAEWKRRKVVTRTSDRYCIQDAAALRLEVR